MAIVILNPQAKIVAMTKPKPSTAVRRFASTKAADE
jgi:hypothetical protein